MIGVLPVTVGAVHDTVTSSLPGTPVTSVGARAMVLIATASAPASVCSLVTST